MRKITLLNPDESYENDDSIMEDYYDDVRYIIARFAERGYEITPQQALSLWGTYSQSMCAEWLDVSCFDWGLLGMYWRRADEQTATDGS